MSVRRLLGVALVLSVMTSGAVSQEFCPPPPARPLAEGAKPAEAKPFVPPEVFNVQQVEGDATLPELVFVGDSLTGGLAAPKLEDRVFARAATLLGGRSVRSLALSGRTSTFIADKFRGVTDVPPDAVLVVWVGRNNVYPAEQVVEDVRSIVSHAGAQRFLVLSVPPTNNPWEAPGEKNRLAVEALNDTLAATFPDNFVSVGTGTTCADRADTVHFAPSGQAKIAAEVAAAVAARGW